MSAAPFSGIVNREEKDRNKEFENCVGNLLVAEYQVHRLRERTKNFLESGNTRLSEFTFKLNGEWYRVSVSAQKQIEPVETPEPKPKKTAPKKKPEPVSPNTSYEAWLPDDEEISFP